MSWIRYIESLAYVPVTIRCSSKFARTVSVKAIPTLRPPGTAAPHKEPCDNDNHGYTRLQASENFVGK